MPFSFIIASFTGLFVVGFILSFGTASSTVHLTIHPRGRILVRDGPANLTQLIRQVQDVESRYGQAARVIRDNKVIRTWRSMDPDFVDASDLLHGIGEPNSWYTSLKLGEPPQSIELDLDTLVPDFYLLSTTSQEGSKFETFFSSTHQEDKDAYVHPNCRIHTDLIHLVNESGNTGHQINIPTCSPPRYSRNTQHSHGGVLGLSPPVTMKRLDSPSFVQKVQSMGIVTSGIWSIALLGYQRGILSLGGSIARAVEEAKIRTQIELRNVGNPAFDRESMDREVASQLLLTFPRDEEPATDDRNSWRDVFRWSSIEGADGWWTTLMSGVWVNGAKILENEPILLDLQVPFILAPPIAARTFYAGISGARRLPEPHDNLYAFPCLNPPNIAFEFAGWMFPTMTSRRTVEDTFSGPFGGRLSLGRVSGGSGYCVGAVIESRFGQGIYSRDGSQRTDRQRRKVMRDSGLHHTWILGEPFFQGIGVVFDEERKQIGFRTY